MDKEQVKEFRIGKGWAIVVYVGGPLIISVFVGLLIMIFLPGELDNQPALMYFLLVPISLAMIALAILGMIDAAKGKFVIDSDRVYTTSALSNRELMFDEISGYRTDDKFIFIESNVQGKKKIRLSNYFSGTAEITEWLARHYPDLNEVRVEREHLEILNNPEFGWTPEQRAARLQSASKAAKTINIIGSLVGAWTFFVARPYEYAILASVIIPIGAILVFRRFNGLMSIDAGNRSAYPTVFWAIMPPAGALCIRALMDFNISDHSNVWMLSFATTVALMAIVLAGNRMLNFRIIQQYLQLFSLTLLMFAYSYGSVITINCVYDNSSPQLFNAHILDKRIQSGKNTNYYFKLTPWGNQSEIQEVSVPEDLYEFLDKDDAVNIYYKKGLLDIPWFVVAD